MSLNPHGNYYATRDTTTLRKYDELIIKMPRQNIS
jgi:hypothetical protein